MESRTPRAARPDRALYPQSSDMPLDELLALYGYEASDPISEHESEGSDTAANLPDMTLDKVSGGRIRGLAGRPWTGGMVGNECKASPACWRPVLPGVLAGAALAMGRVLSVSPRGSALPGTSVVCISAPGWPALVPGVLSMQ